MKRRGSSGRWLDEHRRDTYVARAAREGRVARSAYKLIEIDRRDRLLRPGQTVVDLGAAPGGWSQYAAERVGKDGQVLALDLLPMTAPAGVQVLVGDFAESAVLEALRAALGERRPALVMSDMAPNFSGRSNSRRAVPLAWVTRLVKLLSY